MRMGNDKQTLPCRTVLTHHSLPWSTAKPVVVKVTLPREPWAKPTKEAQAQPSITLREEDEA